MDPGRDPPPGYIRGSRGLQVPKPRPTKSSEVLPSHSHGVGPGGWEDQTTEMRCAPAAHTRRNHLAKASSDGGRRSGTYVKTQRPVDKLTRKGVSRPFGEVTARLRPAPRLFVTPWAIACQALLSTGFSRQERWSRLPCPSPGDLPNPGIKPVSLMSPTLASGFFTTSATWKAQGDAICIFLYSEP